MLARKRRLSKELVKKVLRQGKTVNNQNVSLKYLINAKQPTAFAFVVPSKTAGKSVLRNKLKRRGKTIAFQLLGRVKEGCLVTVFFKKGSRLLRFKDLKTEITQLLQKANIFTL